MESLQIWRDHHYKRRSLKDESQKREHIFSSQILAHQLDRDHPNIIELPNRYINLIPLDSHPNFLQDEFLFLSTDDLALQ